METCDAASVSFITRRRKKKTNFGIFLLHALLAHGWSPRTTILNNQTIHEYFMNRFFAACDANAGTYSVRNEFVLNRCG